MVAPSSSYINSPNYEGNSPFSKQSFSSNSSDEIPLAEETAC